MKRSQLIDKLMNEGFSEKTLVKFNDKQLSDLSERILGEGLTATMADISKSPALQAAAKDPKQNIRVVGEEGDVTEDLKGNQKKIDKNHNGKIDGQDFKILKGQKKEVSEVDMGLTVKGTKSSDSLFGTPKKATTPKKNKNPFEKKEKQSEKEESSDDSLDAILHKAVAEKLEKDLEREPTTEEVDEALKNYIEEFKSDEESDEDSKDVDESKPSAGLSKEKKSDVVKKAKHGGDIGKKGKGFEKLADKAAEKYGSKEKGEKVAGAAMWKNIKREQKEVNEWVDSLVENTYHSYTSKNEIMELIKFKLNESQHGPNVNIGHNDVPEFMTYETDVNEASAPTKSPKTVPTVKPGTKPHNPNKPAPFSKPKPKAVKK